MKTIEQASAIQEKICSRLIELLPCETTDFKKLFETAKYCLEAPSKLLRPTLTVLTCSSYGIDGFKALDPACAIEYIHTYSLIHDDLPCMDNDEYRRGRKTLHCLYNEAVAVLTGDFLLTHAFAILAKANEISDQEKLRIIALLSQQAGGNGMIGGQLLDMELEGKTFNIEQLTCIHNNKTGALISASLEVGGIISGVCNSELSLLAKLGQLLGLAFQVQDDILDITSNRKELGKPVGSDIKNKKCTAVSLLGLQQAQHWLCELDNTIKNIITELSLEKDLLTSYIQSIIHRNF